MDTFSPDIIKFSPASASSPYQLPSGSPKVEDLDERQANKEVENSFTRVQRVDIIYPDNLNLKFK